MYSDHLSKILSFSRMMFPSFDFRHPVAEHIVFPVTSSMFLYMLLTLATCRFSISWHLSSNHFSLAAFHFSVISLSICSYSSLLFLESLLCPISCKMSSVIHFFFEVFFHWWNCLLCTLHD